MFSGNSAYESNGRAERFIYEYLVESETGRSLGRPRRDCNSRPNIKTDLWCGAACCKLNIG